jgi:hypothetical protein
MAHSALVRREQKVEERARAPRKQGDAYEAHMGEPHIHGQTFVHRIFTDTQNTHTTTHNTHRAGVRTERVGVEIGPKWLAG